MADSSAPSAANDDLPHLIGYAPGRSVLMHGPCTTVVLAPESDIVPWSCWYAVLAAEPWPTILHAVEENAADGYLLFDRRMGGRLARHGDLIALGCRLRGGVVTSVQPLGLGVEGVDPITLDGVDLIIFAASPTWSVPELPLLTGVALAGTVQIPLTWAGAGLPPLDAAPEADPPAPGPPPPGEPVRWVRQPSRGGFIDQAPDELRSAVPAAQPAGVPPKFIESAPVVPERDPLA